MATTTQKSVLERIGCSVSTYVSDIAAHPYAQVGVIVVCGLWWVVGLPTDILTATLSILAITMTQMVLNRQDVREADAHRRDVAMHAKIDELVIAMKGARNEMAGIEELDEADIEELKQVVGEAIDEAGEEAGDARERAAAKRAASHALDDELSNARGRPRLRAGAKG
jgi:low affinity Fe/Cu permease